MEISFKEQTKNAKKEFKFKLLSSESAIVILLVLAGAGYLSYDNLATILANIMK